MDSQRKQEYLTEEEKRLSRDRWQSEHAVRNAQRATAQLDEKQGKLQHVAETTIAQVQTAQALLTDTISAYQKE